MMGVVVCIDSGEIAMQDLDLLGRSDVLLGKFVHLCV